MKVFACISFLTKASTAVLPTLLLAVAVALPVRCDADGAVNGQSRSQAEQTPVQGKIDLTYQPISSADVIKQADADAIDPSALYMLVNRAAFAGHYTDLLRELLRLHKSQPNNAILIDIIYFALLQGPIVNDPPASRDMGVMKAALSCADLDAAMKLDPHLWFTLMLKGRSEIYGGGAEQKSAGVALMKQAAAMVPNCSIPRYMFAVIVPRPPDTYEQHLSEDRIALTLKPYIARLWLNIAFYYSYIAPDHKQKEYACSQFLKSVPPGAVTRLDDGAKVILGVPVKLPSADNGSAPKS